MKRSRPQPSSIAGRHRRNRIAGQFTALLTDMLESPAWRMLSLSARRVLDRVAIELRHHGGHEGEGLCVTYADFQKYGIGRHSIAPAIRQAIALGFLRVTRQGRAGNSEFRRSTLYKLTYVNTVDGEPGHDWKRIRSLDEAEAKAREARADLPPRKTKLQWGKPPPASVGETPTDEGDFPVGVSPTQRDTRRYQFSSAIEAIDLGLRLGDIAGLEREPAAATKTSPAILHDQLVENGAAEAEIAILLSERVELNAMASDDLIAMIERKLKHHGLKKIVPDDDLLGDTYRAFHRSKELKEHFDELEAEFKESKIKVPKDLTKRVRVILGKHPDLRWDDAVQIVLDESQLDHVRAKKQKAKKKSGDFTDVDEDEEGAP
jgi:hypothetical protein